MHTREFDPERDLVGPAALIIGCLILLLISLGVIV